ncbi:MAG: 50S ribosomal protein L18e [Candidatus Micrarchaeota archaeon]|nr:50S ribosomal protein L18e [Candidatus Micrarchaeota archaeon]MDE1804369.1 50S ribosomal protein L18e [Candidatus Micrarchaeota archaeon]MDE1846613.1 50S ribosomal protein L18e [Candidatus Micrarchaeota archaeon]
MKSIIEKDAINSWNEAITSLKADSKNAGLWQDVRQLISQPRRSRVVVNLNKIDRLTKDGEFIVVPGKVLSFGRVNHKIRIAAVEYSQSAIAKLKGSGCEMVPIEEMLKKENPRIII